MRLWFAPLLIFFATACQPLRTYYAEGVSVADLERDDTDCDVVALQAAPVATVVRQGPPVYIPRRYCNHHGHCYSRGYWVPGDIYTVDVNRNLRRRVKGQCMAEKGYRPVEIPICPPSVAEAAPPGRTTILPSLNENTCAIRNEDRSIQIVQRG